MVIVVGKKTRHILAPLSGVSCGLFKWALTRVVRLNVSRGLSGLQSTGGVRRSPVARNTARIRTNVQ